jgi:oligoribonuclease NrnB/cAMP/cGMP phosphodiesterase (DHH superfamily)
MKDATFTVKPKTPAKSPSGIYILYHFPCQDGFGAAYAAWKKFGDQAVYQGVSYGKPIPELIEPKEVYIVDFSYPKDELVALAEKCKVVVLDHHKSAEEQLSGLEFAQFDMYRSGAGMAWDYFHGKDSRPWFINYIEDRDLWLHKMPNAHEIAAALFSYPMDFNLWDSFNQEVLLTEGKAILRYKTIITNEMTTAHRLVDFLEFKQVPVVNASSSLVSDVGEVLNQKYPTSPFCAIYYDTKDGKRKWSLRSTYQQVDVAEVAGRFGGGGHRNASGFIEPIPETIIQLKPKA